MLSTQEHSKDLLSHLERSTHKTNLILMSTTNVFPQIRVLFGTDK